MNSVAFLLILSAAESTIDLSIHEIDYLSDHMSEKECRKLVALLHFRSFDFPSQVVAAERKLPDDVTCRDLLLHWNSEEGRGGTHIEVCHRLNQIERRDLAQWLSRTTFHRLAMNMEDSMSFPVTDETRTRFVRMTDSPKQVIVDEAPWWNLDSFLAVLVVLAVGVFGCGAFYLVFLCCFRVGNWATNHSRIKPSEEETENLIDNDTAQ